MRLGVDVRCLQDATITGVAEVTWQLLQGLALDKELVLEGYLSGSKGVPAGVIPQAMHLHKAFLPSRLNNLALTLQLGPGLASTLGHAREPLDILWLPNPSFIHIGAKIPAVLTVHDLSFIHEPNFFRWRGRAWYFPAVERLLRQGPGEITHIVAVSKHTAQDLVEVYPGWQGHVSTIPLGLDTIYQHQPSPLAMAAVRDKYQLPEQYLLSVGTLEPRKNHRLLLQAYATLAKSHIPAYDLVLAGAWGWKTKALQHELRSLPEKLRSHVHILGYVPREDKVALYTGALLFVYPSFYEGFGLPVLEAMACGTPVLTSHNSALPEAAGGAGILLDPYRVAPWVEAIAWLTQDAPARLKLTAQGKARTQNITWQATTQAYRALFDQLVR